MWLFGVNWINLFAQEFIQPLWHFPERESKYKAISQFPLITGKKITIDETNEKLFYHNGEPIHNFIFKDELQSNLTDKIILDIFNNGKCLLPTLKDSSNAHYELFEFFNKRICTLY